MAFAKRLENRNALVVDCRVTLAADRPGACGKIIGTDKNDGTKGFVAEMCRLGVSPHGPQNKARIGASVIDGRTTRHKG